MISNINIHEFNKTSIKRNLSIIGLIIFCSMIGHLIIDNMIWYINGVSPKYTHIMWYQDRLDTINLNRINEDNKLQNQITELQTELNKLRELTLELNN